MTIVLMTTNRWKIPEYRRFFARHAQPLVVETPPEDPAAVATWLATARAVLADDEIEQPIADAAQQEFATVAEASACAFDQSQPSPSNAGRA